MYIKLLNWGKLDKIKYENIDFELGSTKSLTSGDILTVTLLGTWVGNFNFQGRHIFGYNRLSASLIRHITEYVSPY